MGKHGVMESRHPIARLTLDRHERQRTCQCCRTAVAARLDKPAAQGLTDRLILALTQYRGHVQFRKLMLRGTRPEAVGCDYF